MNAALEPIARRPLHDELVERIQALIASGELAPGSRIPEQKLCRRFGVSRTPLREALKVLASKGFLQLLPRRGAVVTRLCAADVNAMFQVMGALEGLAGDLACAAITDAELAAIAGLHSEMRASYEARDEVAYFSANQQIHERILRTTGNPFLIDTYLGLAEHVRNSRYSAAMSSVRWRQSLDEHEAILEALQNRDGKALARLLQDHLQTKCATVKEALSAGETAPSD